MKEIIIKKSITRDCTENIIYVCLSLFGTFSKNLNITCRIFKPNIILLISVIVPSHF
jgi:hypothetical protein